VEKSDKKPRPLQIVGTGPAGIIILALEYQQLQPKHTILLIEYGTDSGCIEKFGWTIPSNIETKNPHSPRMHQPRD